MVDVIGLIGNVLGFLREINSLVHRCHTFREAPPEFRQLNSDCQFVSDSLNRLKHNLQRIGEQLCADDFHLLERDARTVYDRFNQAMETCNTIKKYFPEQPDSSGFRTRLSRLKQALFRFIFANDIATQCRHVSKVVRDAYVQGTALHRFLNVSVQMTHFENQAKRVEHAIEVVAKDMHTIATDTNHLETTVEHVETGVRHIDVGVRDMRDKVQCIHHKVEHVGDDVRLMRENMHNIVKSTHRSPTHLDDHFKPPQYPHIPSLSPKIVLDFTTLDAQNMPVTMEGRLKRALLDKDSRREYSRIAVAVGAHGKGGVGKTKALIGLGWDKDVRERFKNGGVYYLSFGKDATEGKVIEQLALAVENSGGVQRATRVLASKSLSVAIQLVECWFGERETLLLCDDMWETAQSSVGYLDDMRQLLTSHGRIHIVISTRARSIAKTAGESVEFGPRDPDGELSLSILLKYAEISKDMLECCRELEDPIRRILRKCRGVPLLLGVAGSAIQTKANNCEWAAAVFVYAEELERNTRNMMTEDVEGYPNLCATVSTSLKMVNELARKKEICAENGEALVFSDLFIRMSVFPRQSQIPQETVKRLWGGLDNEDVSRIIDKLVDLNLMWKREDKANGVTVGLHDLILEYCEIQARNPRSFHQNFLGEYLSVNKHMMALSSTVEDCSLEKLSAIPEARNWWRLSSDGYLPENVCWHLLKGGYVGELMALLCDVRWTVFRMRSGGLLRWKNDFETLKDALREVKKGAGQEDEWDLFENGIMLVQEAVNEAWVYLRGNERELGLQVHSRLFDVDKSVSPVNRFLASSWLHCTEPWLFPLGRYWPYPGRGPSLELVVNEAVNGVAMTRDKAMVAVIVDREVWIMDVKSRTLLSKLIGHEEKITSVCTSDNGEMIVSGSKDGTLRRWDGRSGKPIGDPHSGHREAVSCIAMTADRATIVSGSTDGTLRIWGGETGKPIGEPLRGHNSSVSCLAMSKDGEILVSGSEDKTLQRWNANSGIRWGESLRGHDDHVTCVVISGDGAIIVSGSKDGTLRRWDGKEGNQIGEPLRGHDDQVTCIAMSSDAAHLVSGSYDMSLIRWDGRTGSAIDSPLRGHHRKVSCVAISEDGMLVISGSHDDGTVCLWERRSETSESGPLHRPNDVTCVAISENGAMVASGWKDGTLRRWNGKTGKPIVNLMRGHAEEVCAIAMSTDGAVIVSGSKDGTIQRWDGDTGATAGKPLIAHGPVSGVAISSDGAFIVSVSHETVQLWDPQIHAEIGRSVHGRGLKSIEIENYAVLGRLFDGSLIHWRIDKTSGLVNEQECKHSTERTEGDDGWALRFRSHQLILDGQSDELVLGTMLSAISVMDYRKVRFPRGRRVEDDIGTGSRTVGAIVAAGSGNGTVCIFHLITE